MPRRRTKPSARYVLIFTLLCAVVAAAQVLGMFFFLQGSKEAFHPSILMTELPLPLIAALIFRRGARDGAWILITTYIAIMGVFWCTGAAAMLAIPEFFLGMLLINLGALGTYAAYALFSYLRKLFTP